MAEIPNIKPNSSRYREQKNAENDHRFEKVVKGNAKKKQVSALQKFAKGFIPEDAKSIKDYVADEAPGFIMGFLRWILQKLLDTYLPDKGGYYRGNPRTSLGTNTTVRYDAIRGTGNSSLTGVRQRNTNAVYEYENVIFDDYRDADEVLNLLYDCLARYEKVRVFDLYDLAGIAPKATDRNYGWTDLQGVNVVPTSDGFVIDLPRAVPLF